MVSLLRRGDDPGDTVVAVVSFTPVPRSAYRIGVPRAGTYLELLNSDAAAYGGSNIGNEGQVRTEPIPAHGFEQSLSLMVPPLGFLLFKLEAPPAAEPVADAAEPMPDALTDGDARPVVVAQAPSPKPPSRSLKPQAPSLKKPEA